MLLTLLGGVGIFLVGMTLLTEGLRVAAGAALRQILARFTRNRFSAVASGALVTGLTQSSSATTLATIGFVSAGLMTFQQALGVIFGANVGTTSTGWLVSTVGLKVDITMLAFPLIGAGAVVMLLGNGARAAIARAVVGFGLIFVGIDFLQDGMTSLADDLDPGTFQGQTLQGRILLVLLGVAMTVLMQSSSAAVATTLAALDAGAIDLNEGAALVIGQNLGTTVTAGIAAIGASLSARRTALAHVLFNALTGVVALSALPIFVDVSQEVAEGDPAISLAAFHTLFNVAGVVILLPVTRQFSRLVERLLPEREPDLVSHLDDTVLDVPHIAIDTSRRTIGRIAEAALAQAEVALEGGQPTRVAEIGAALQDLQRFVTRISATTERDRVTYLGVLHGFDHLHQVVALVESAPPREVWRHFSSQRALVDQQIRATRTWLAADTAVPIPEEIAQAARELADWRTRRRRELLEEIAATIEEEPAAGGGMAARLWRWRPRRRVDVPPSVEPAPALSIVDQLDAMVWVARLAHHVWRLTWHSAIAAGQQLEGEPRVTFDPA